ncbi:MAG: nucleotidyltransferase domain-containing protein [Nanoarchaeota archaeon]
MQKSFSGSRELISRAKEFKKSHDAIWDIVIYGSTVRGKEQPRDLDVAIILSTDAKLSEKLHLAQEFKSTIANPEADVRAVAISDLLDQTFLARQGIIAEGYSITRNACLHTLFGFSTCAVITLSQKNLTASQKKMFFYALHGRRGESGLLKEKRGEKLGAGALKVPLEHMQEFEDILQKHHITYKIRKASFY